MNGKEMDGKIEALTQTSNGQTVVYLKEINGIIEGFSQPLKKRVQKL